MTPKRILVLHGHPGDASLCKALTQSYAQAARDAGHDVREHDLGQLNFDMDFGGGGYTHFKPLEPELEVFASDLEWAQHIALSTPLWWGAIPAKLKGLFDRTLLPGRSFDTRNTTLMGLPKPMLQGKTARVFLTADTPAFLLRLMYGDAVKKVISRQILGFVGIKPTRFTQFGPASHAKPEKVSTWLARAGDLGARAV